MNLYAFSHLKAEFKGIIFKSSREKKTTHPQHGGVPEPAAHVPVPLLPTSPAAPLASAAARLSPGCGGRTPASARSGSSWHVQAEEGAKEKGSCQTGEAAGREVCSFH